MPDLVTGAAGFIGSHVVDGLIAKGRFVVALDDLSGGFRDNVNPKAVFVTGSVTDKALVERLFNEYRFDCVFHLAAYAAESLSHFIRRFNYENNLLGSVNLINASVNHGVKCFIFTSSIAVYGSGQVPMAETLIPQPEDPYGIAKYAVELDLRAAHDLFGLNYIIFRLHNVYGERQNMGDRYRNVIGIFMEHILRGKPLPIYGDGEQTRSFTYIDDVAPVIAASALEPSAHNQVFNVGSDDAYSVIHVARVVSRALGVGFTPLHLPARKEVQHAVALHEKLRRVLGYQSRYSLEEGVARMAAWAQSAARRRSAWSGALEIETNLPSTWLQGLKDA